jgi:hypothetical protein
MYKKLSNIATQRETAEVVNRILDGGINSIGEIRLYPGVNELLNERLGYDSVILFSAKSAGAFLPYTVSREKGKASIGYDGANNSDFYYVIFG